MKIICLSASNVKSVKENSASTRVCKIIKDYVGNEYNGEIDVEIITLVDSELSPCIMCCECNETGKCTYDEAFNNIVSKISEADGLFVVCPHYAPIPSKLIMLLEKIEELAFIHYCSKKTEKFITANKPVAIIGHGGMAGDVDEYYKNALLEPLSKVFKALQMDVVGINEEWPNGVVFGLKDAKFVEGSLLPEMKHDWEDISNRVIPLINSLIQKIK